MSYARIYQPSKTAMQSSQNSNSRRWRLEFEPEGRKTPNALIGWPTSTDTKGQVVLYFDDKQQAIDHVERLRLPYKVMNFHEKKWRPKNYASNFDFNRKQSWTH